MKTRRFAFAIALALVLTHNHRLSAQESNAEEAALNNGIEAFASGVNQRSAEGVALSHGHLRFSLPGRWNQQRSENQLAASSPEIADAGFLILSPTPPMSQTIFDFLQRGYDGFESGRTTLRVQPPQPQQGVNSLGLPYIFQSRASRGPAGDVRFTAVVAFPAGARFQAVVALSKTAEGFSKLMSLLGPALDKASIEMPRAGAPPLRGQSDGFLVYSLQRPADWKLDSAIPANIRSFTFDRIPGRAQAYGGGYNLRTTIELQPTNPGSPLIALENFLLNRAGLTWHWNRQDNPLRITVVDEGRLNNGLEYAGMAIEQSYDDRYYLGGYIIRGPGYSLLIGTGMRYFRYDIIKLNSTAVADRNNWHQFRRSLLSMAETIRWNPTGLRRLEDREAWLKRKRTLRYSRESSLVSGDMSYLSSRSASWDFAEDGSARHQSNAFQAFNSVNTITPTGIPERSSGYLTGARQGQGSSFQVIARGAEEYILLQHASGLATYHRLTVQPQFSIDGYLDGCCQ